MGDAQAMMTPEEALDEEDDMDRFALMILCGFIGCCLAVWLFPGFIAKPIERAIDKYGDRLTKPKR